VRQASYRSIPGFVLAAGLVVAVFLVPGGAGAGPDPTTSSFTWRSNAKIANGDYVAAGYSFKVPGSHPRAWYVFAYASVTINGRCSNGGSDSITMPLSRGPFDEDALAYAFDVPLNEHGWFPTKSTNSSDSYLGSLLVSDVCGGGDLRSESATFSADVQSTNTQDAIKIRFHFIDPNAKGKENIDCMQPSADPHECNSSWSPPQRVVPDLVHVSPSIETVPKLLGVDAQGFGSATDEATLLGALDPTGTLTYYVYNSDRCDGFPAGTSTVVVTGPHVPPSGVFTFLPPGIHQFVAIYSGDAINDTVTSPCGAERLVWSHD
jgi:hypothetical protein